MADAATPDLLDQVFAPAQPIPAAAVQQVESSNDPNAVSVKGARGLMQTMPNTLKDPGYGVRPAQDDSPAELQRVGNDYLSAMETKYNGNPRLALMGYNWGPGNTDTWLAQGADPKKVPQETRDYLQKVAKASQPLVAPLRTASATGPDLLDSVFNSAEGKANPVVGPTAQAAPSPNWNMGTEAANAYLLGAGKPIAAASHAAQELYGHVSAGVPLGTALGQFPSDYSYANRQIGQQQGEWEQQNPGKSIVANLAGIVPTAAALASGQEYAAEPAAAALSKAVPSAAPVVNFLTGNLAKSAPWLARRASQAVTGAVAGAAAGGLQSQIPPENRDFVSDLVNGAKTGAVLNPAVSQVAEPLISSIAPKIASAANNLIKSGVKVSAGQIPGVSPVISLLSKAFGSSAGDTTGLTQAVSRTFGQDTPTIDNALISKADTSLNKGFQGWANNSNIRVDPQLQDEVSEVINKAGSERGIPDESFAKLSNTAQQIVGGGHDSTLTGKDYLNLTKRGGMLDSAMRDPMVSDHASALRDALDGALERSVADSFGRWVPAEPAAGSNPIMTSGQKALPAPGTNMLLGTGDPNAIKPPVYSNSTAMDYKGGTFQQDDPIHQSLGPPPQTPAPAPGMVWEIDPRMHDALNQIQDLRANWKNLTLVRPLVNDTTGEIDPQALSRRIARFYPPSDEASAGARPSATVMTNLSGAGTLVPKDMVAKPQTILDQIKGAASHTGPMILGGAVAADYSPEALHWAAQHPLQAGLAAASTAGVKYLGKGLNAAVNSKWNTNRLISNAMNNGGTGFNPATPNLLLAPPAVQLSNYAPERQSQ